MKPVEEFATLLTEWEAGSGPLYLRLSGAIKSAISNVKIMPGAKLPAERALARELGVSRTTVAQAYDSLRAEGWAESRQGSGTWVRATGESFPGMPGLPPLLTRAFFRAADGGHSSVPIDLSVAGPKPLDLVVSTAIRLDLERVLPALPPTGYMPFGLPLLRRLLASRFTEGGAPTHEDQILVTSGAQQAISLIASMCLQRGDAVALESPTYAGALDAFSRAGARLVPLPVGRGGVDVDRLRETVRAVRPRLVYLMPTFQNPTGEVMSERERRRISAIADEFQVTVIEDNTLADVSLDGVSRPPLANYSEGSTLISIGSMSKLFWPGLRVGWVRAAEATIAGLGQLKVVNDLGTSVLSQALACRLLPETPVASLARKEELTAKMHVLESGLTEKLPDWTWKRPRGGLFLWVKVPVEDGRAFAEVALRHGVAITPGAALSPDGKHDDYVRICFVASEEDLQVGVDRLAEAWASFGWSSTSTPSSVLLPV
ncbi:MAG: PLP-dependent aminotransferase family protein [Actinomycetota bacterium]|nr:PLP-dependent aminotransferase family protein [Actinomycetota bacterium]